MQVGLLLLALVSGLATVMFVMNGLRRAFIEHKRLGMRALMLTAVMHLLTGAFTVWQLVLVAQKLPLGP